MGSCSSQNIELVDWYKKKAHLLRQFSIQSTSDTETLVLKLEFLAQMEQEFADYFTDLFDMAITRLKTAWVTKLNAMKNCLEQHEDHLRKQGDETLMANLNRSVKGLNFNSQSIIYEFEPLDLDQLINQQQNNN